MAGKENVECAIYVFKQCAYVIGIARVLLNSVNFVIHLLKEASGQGNTNTGKPSMISVVTVILQSKSYAISNNLLLLE